MNRASGSTMDRRRFVASAGLGVAGLCISGARAVRSADDLDAFVHDRMAMAHIPGLSLAVIQNGKLVRATAFGFANLARQQPMRADTLINVGSVTKTATCLAVMQLWEQKQFSLDANVSAYLSFPVRNATHPGAPITFRQLLTHTSSIADGPAYERSYACGDPRVPLRQWLRDYLTPEGELYDSQRNFHPWAPGQQFEYSNVAYGLLGHLVETLSGMDYSDYMRNKIFVPLGMSHSRVLLAGMEPQSHATPYTYVADRDLATVELRDPTWRAPSAGDRAGVQVPRCLYSWSTPPDGSLRTSAVELSHLLRVFMNGGAVDGRRVLQSQTVAQILTDQRVPFSFAQARAQPQGLAWRQYRGLGPGQVWGHSGGDPGISSLAVFRLEDRRGAVILMNSDDGLIPSAEIAQRLLAR